MHELSIAQSVVETACGVVKEQGASRVVSLTIDAGLLSGVVKESLLFCLPLAAKGTAAEDAKWIVNTIPVEISCRRCETVSKTDEVGLICSKCESFDIEIVSGRELTIRELEIE
jgi:hydrogenase nickel incorporation protein HypA/HybF